MSAQADTRAAESACGQGSDATTPACAPLVAGVSAGAGAPAADAGARRPGPCAASLEALYAADPDAAAVRRTEDRTSAAWSGAPGEVVFYRLTKKFVESQESIPEESKQVMYYTLAIGHHTGVIDCFEPALGCSRELFDRIVSLFPEGSDARYKLGGIARYGEIQIDKSHVATLLPAVDQVLQDLGYRGSAKAGIDVQLSDFGVRTQEVAWLMQFEDLLGDVRDEVALYLTGRGKE